MEQDGEEIYTKIDQERDKNTEWDFFSINNKTSKFWPNECSVIDYSVKASTLNEYGQKGSELVFSVTTTGWLDPSSIHLSFRVYNGCDYPCQLDGSAHSIFSEFTVMVNGNKLENYKEYGRMHKFMSDLRLSQRERERRSDEGFGKSRDGDDEHIFKGIVDEVYSNKVAKDKLGEYIIYNNELEGGDLIGEDMNIKVESCIFGNRISEKNWKIIPLDQLDIKFIYKLSPTFGFIPREIIFEGAGKDDADKYYKELTGFKDKFYFNSYVYDVMERFKVKFSYVGKELKGKLSNMKLIKPVLKFKKYIFSEEWNNKLKADYNRIPMIFEMNSFDILVTKWIDKTPSSLLMSIMLNSTQERVRAIYGAAYLVNENDYQRLFGRFNPGFSKMQIQSDNTYWPYDSFFDKTEVYNINSKKSVRPILYKILRFNNISDIKFKSKFNKIYQDDSYTMNKENMARLLELSYIDSKVDLVFLKDDKKDSYTENYGVCKWLNLVSFDTVPYSNDKVIGGMRVEMGNAINILFKKSMESINTKPFPDYYKSIQQYNMYLIMESNQIMRMGVDGSVQIN